MPRLFQVAKDLGMPAILMTMKKNHSEFLPLKSVQKSLLTFELEQARLLNVNNWDIGHQKYSWISIPHVQYTHGKMESERVCVRSASHEHCDSEASLHQLLKGQALVLGLVQPLFIGVICLLCVFLRWNDFYNLHNLFVTLKLYLFSAFCVQERNTKSFYNHIA